MNGSDELRRSKVEFSIRRAGDFWNSPEMLCLFPHTPSQSADLILLSYLKQLKQCVKHPSNLPTLLSKDCVDKTLSHHDVLVLHDKCMTLVKLYENALNYLPRHDMNWKHICKMTQEHMNSAGFKVAHCRDFRAANAAFHVKKST